MPRKMLPDGTWVHQTWEEVEAEASPEMLRALRTPIPIIDPETLTEGQRSLYERMQSAGPGRVVEVEDGHPDVG